MAVNKLVIDEPCRPKPYGLSLDQKKLHDGCQLFIGNAEFVEIAMYSQGS